MKNLKAIKSTVLGLAMIIFSSVLLYKNITHDYYINGVLYTIGLLLLFTGDSWIIKLEELVYGYFKNKIEKKNDSE